MLVTSCDDGKKDQDTSDSGSSDSGSSDIAMDTRTDTVTDAEPDTDTDTYPDTNPDTGDEQCGGKNDFTVCSLVTDPDRSYDICVRGYCVSPGCGDVSCNPSSLHFPLADTNQRVCYSNSSRMTSCPGSGESLYGQDAQYGWDRSHESTDRFTRDTTISLGNPLVTDNITGLVWQGCAVGFSGKECAIRDSEISMTYNWDEALAYCNSLSWGGYDDWRLPDAYELQSIVDCSVDRRSIDAAAFPETPNSFFWSSFSYAPLTSGAWGVEFFLGRVDYDTKMNHNYVRCVRSEPTPQPARFTRDTATSDYPMVTDNRTGLIWQGCAAGFSGDACGSGSAEKKTWMEAIAYCEALDWAGQTDWRLPNVKELQSIVDYTTDYEVDHRSIDTAAFPTTPNDYFWSSTTLAAEASRAWYVRFTVGREGDNDKTTDHYVRCVRGGL